MNPTPLYKNRDEFVTVLDKALAKAKFKVSAAIAKAILSALRAG